jgi:hypothetical protein
MPDILTRVAQRTVDALNVDVGGVLRVFHHTVSPYDDSFTQVGGGGSVNADIRVTSTTRLIAQSAFGSGMGRYVGGLVPDVSFGSDGSIRPIGTVSWVAGIEQKVSPRAALAAYESGVVTDHRYALDVDGGYIGYGFPGSPNSNNRWIQELTGTFSYLVTKTQRRGSVQLGVQTSWLKRVPWSQGSGPPSASALLFFAQIRYNLP